MDKDYFKNYYLVNREQQLAKKKARWVDDTEFRTRRLNQIHNYKIKHKDELLAKRNIKERFKRATDLNFKLKTNLRVRLINAIRTNQKAGSAIRDLGCSIAFLKQYIEDKFLPGMTWDNWGRGNNKWNIDHIIPLSNFNLADRDQLLKAVHYTNLQPLWQPDNFKKGGIKHGS